MTIHIPGRGRGGNNGEISRAAVTQFGWEAGGTRGGFYALWRGSLKQRDPKSEPHDHFRQQQLLLQRPRHNHGGSKSRTPAPSEKRKRKKTKPDWNGTWCCSQPLHLNISNLKKVIFLDVKKSLRPNNKTWWEMTGGSDKRGKYRSGILARGQSHMHHISPLSKDPKSNESFVHFVKSAWFSGYINC